MAEPSREKTGSARELVRKLLRLKVVEEAYRSDRSTACNQCGQAIQTSAISTVYYRLEDPRPIIHRRFCSARCGDEYEIETAVRAGFIKAGEVRRDEPKAAQIASHRQPPPSPASRPKPVGARSSPIRTSEIARLVDRLKALGFQVERKGDDIILTGRIKSLVS